MALVCHVILQDHVIKGLSNFIDKSRFKRLAIILSSLATIVPVVVKK